jgi:hypothetical protein
MYSEQKVRHASRHRNNLIKLGNLRPKSLFSRPISAEKGCLITKIGFSGIKILLFPKEGFHLQRMMQGRGKV